MSLEDQFDVAAQDRRAQAALKARLEQVAVELEQVADDLEAEIKAEVAEVPEVPGKVDQEPEIKPEDVCCGNPEPHSHEGPNDPDADDGAGQDLQTV